MRLLLDVVRASFVAGAAAFAALGAPGLALQLAVVGAALVAARVLAVPLAFDAAFAATMVALVWGGLLGLAAAMPAHDLALHATVPLFGAPLATLAAARSGLVLPVGRLGFVLLTLAFGLAIGAAWEVLEWTLDLLVGTDFARTARDTATDLVADACGAVLGALLLLGTRRRDP